MSPHFIMNIRKAITQLEIEDKDGTEKLPTLTVIFILTYMIFHLVELLPWNPRLRDVKKALYTFLGEYLYYYKTERFKSPDLAEKFGKYSRVGLHGLFLTNSDDPNGFTWERFEDLFKSYRSITK